MDVAATVILYHPDKGFEENIKTYAGNVGRLYILDNSESGNSHEELLNQFPNAYYEKFNNNMGIGLRLNQAAQMAMNDGYSFLLTMDQDSGFNIGVFEKYLSKIEQTEKVFPGTVGVYAVNYQPQITPVSEKETDVASTITSGSMINLRVYKKTKGYNESLFLDLVDAEYCYQVTGLGYKVRLFPDIVLNHTIGMFTKGRSLKNFKVSSRRIHSPIRIYYIVRNCLYMLKHGNLNEAQRKEVKACLGLLKNNLLYHPTKGKVVKFLIKGVTDFKKRKLGRFEK